MTLALVGPTASGKSALAMAVARERGDVEIVSVDAMQVYRRMDIGTAKPSPADQRTVPHHVIDVAEPSGEYTVSMYQHDARRALAGIHERGNLALLVGGTGLYLRALTDELDIPPRFEAVREQLEAERDTAALHRRLVALDPVASARMEPTNRRRVVRALEVCIGSGRPFSSFGPGLAAYRDSDIRMIGVRLDRAVLDARIEARYHEQLERGFLDEVRRLVDEPLSRTARQALGYKELIEHVEGRVLLDEALQTAIARTRRFARRQERWFRRDPRLRWVDASIFDQALEAVLGECALCS